MSTLGDGLGRSDALMDQGNGIYKGDPAILDKFVQFALANPVKAADRLGWWFDCVVTHHEGSDDCRALENWAYAPNLNDLSFIAYRAAHSRWPASVRVALAAIVAGGLAYMDDLKDAA